MSDCERDQEIDEILNLLKPTWGQPISGIPEEEQ